MKDFFETASFHIVKPCNMKCKFCFATFNDFNVNNQLDKYDAFDILDKLKGAGLKKITFAGGEPLLYKYIYEVIIYSKAIGLTTSIITNGSLLNDKFLDLLINNLDWIGISIDSLNPETNVKIGRTSKLNLNYMELISKIKERGYRLKINTVVNRYNEKENMQEFIDWANPSRWKIFDTLKIEGQNDKHFNEIRTTADIGFHGFLNRHNHPSMVPEDNEKMTGSYLLIDPKGRLFEDSKGTHTYSDPLHYNSIEHCMAQISLDRKMFIERGGIYKWDKN